MKKVFIVVALFVGILISMTSAMTASADNGIPIPYSDNKTIWQLGTDPFTRYLGPYFFVIMIGTFSGVIWIVTQSTAPALAFFIVVMGVLSGAATTTDLIPGDWAMVFMLFAILASIPVFMKVFVKG